MQVDYFSMPVDFFPMLVYSIFDSTNIYYYIVPYKKNENIIEVTYLNNTTHFIHVSLFRVDL